MLIAILENAKIQTGALLELIQPVYKSISVEYKAAWTFLIH